MSEQGDDLSEETAQAGLVPEAPPALKAADALPPLRRPLPERIAERLGETQPGPLAQIIRMLSLWGPERVKALCQEALTIYAGEGMLVENGQRKRTPGGIFFYLARQQASEEEWQRILPRPFVPRAQRPKAPKRQEGHRPGQPPARAPKAAPAAPTTSAAVPLPTWAELWALVETLKESVMKTTLKLIGRPSDVKSVGAYILFPVVSQQVPALPAGLPKLSPGTKYLVLVAAKQWNKVAPGLEADPEAKVLIEGYPAQQSGYIAVEATTCTLLSRPAPTAQPSAPAGAEGGGS
jgi:hypothetical protein